VLTISGERVFHHGDGHCHQIERSYGAFLRALAAAARGSGPPSAPSSSKMAC